MKKILIIPLLLSACAMAPGHVQFEESKVDGKKYLQMSRAWAGEMMMSLYKTSTMEPGKLLLGIQMPFICASDLPQEVIFRIDNSLDTLRDEEKMSKCEVDADQGRNYSERMIYVERVFVEKLINSKETYFKWGPKETKLSRGPTTAVNGFKSFLSMMDQKGLQ